MRKLTSTILAIAIVATLTAAGSMAYATVITTWDFNGLNGAGTTSPSGPGTLSLIGGTTGSFVAGYIDSGTGDGHSSDPAGSTNNKAYNVSTFPAVGAGNKTAGVQFAVSTKGYNGISLSFDTRHSATASGYVRLQYTTNGTDWNDSTLFNFIDSTGTDFHDGNVVDLSSLSGVNDNSAFAFRLVAEFAPSTSGYATSKTGTSNYGTSGTMRYDMVQVTGSAIPTPEPASMAAMLTGMIGLAGFAIRRRQS